MGKLFVDDNRPMPKTGYIMQCQDVASAKFWLTNTTHDGRCMFDGISLDYNLGEGGTGLEILEFMKENGISFPIINIHSDNIIGRELMSEFCGKYFPETEVTFRPG